MKNIKYLILKIKKKIATSAFGLLAMTVFLIAGLVFPKPALAISPPFPTTNWLHQETSSVIGSNSYQASDSDMDQVENTAGTTIKPAKTTNEIQWWPGVTARTTAGTTNGRGWIFDSPLNGQYNAGTWNLFVRIRVSAGGNPTAGTISAYVFRYNSSTSTYTSLGTASLTGVAPTGTASTQTITWSPGALDMQGEYLYVHYTWQTTTVGSATNATAIAFHVEGTGLSAANKARIVPPGSSIDALGYSLIAISIAFFIAVLVKKRILYVKKVSIA